MRHIRTHLETTMYPRYSKPRSTWEWAVLLLVPIALILLSTRTFGADAKQQTFATSDEAVSALVAAVKANDTTTIRAILGSKPGELSSGDRVADNAMQENFVAAYTAKHALVQSGDAMRLTIGNDDFPFAFPLVKTGDRWHFDAHAGKDELIARRIGENELDAIKVLQAMVDAEREYASADRNGNGVVEYAMKFASSPGKRDGLYWPAKAGEPPSPLGELVVRAGGEGYRGKQGSPTPYHGYYYRMLKGQTANAAGGATDYVVRGRAIGGFAVVAYPAKYGS